MRVSQNLSSFSCWHPLYAILRLRIKFSVSLSALLNKSLIALFSGIWKSGANGFSVGGEVATAEAAIEIDMEDVDEVESAEVVEVEAGAALEGVKGQAEVEREAYKHLQMKAFPSK